MKQPPTHRRSGLLVRRWRSLALTAVLLVLAGAVTLVWLRLDEADRRTTAEAQKTERVAAEADRRGDAVTTLATDVRVLRSQIQADGGTPAAPDPARAVEDLPDRAEVPVPIPGRQGEQGPQGEPGRPGRDAPAPSPGPTGPPGESVTGPPGETVVGPAGPVGPEGPAGPAGQDGTDGTDGKDGEDGADGRDGQNCPAGYTLQPPPDDPDALVCRRTAAPEPDPDPPPGNPTPAALAPERRRS